MKAGQGHEVIVVGGGLAGLSAAAAMADAGASVLLIEPRKLLGGRAGSFYSPAMGAAGQGQGRLLDNSQHVLLGCCDQLQAFYARLGAAHLIQFQDRLVFADPSGRRGVFRAAPLPAPLHLAPSMLGFGLLSLGHRMEIARAMLGMKVIGRKGRERYAGISFAQLLGQMHQSPEVIAAFWDVICVSALNEPCSTAAAHYGLQVFQEAFLGQRGGYRLGFARVPLSMLYERLPEAVRTVSGSVQSLLVEQGRVVGAQLADRPLRADQVILATPPWAAAALLGAELLQADAQLSRVNQLEYRPIIGAHFQFDREILDVPNLALMGTRLHWVFADPQDPRLIHGVASAADDLCQLPAEAVTELFLRELGQVCPAVREAKLGPRLIVKEKRATFRPLPGVDELRPSQKTAIPGLTLAGDYTRTGWPSTMEGAVRSGRLAAEAACEALGGRARA